MEGEEQRQTDLALRPEPEDDIDETAEDSNNDELTFMQGQIRNKRRKTTRNQDGGPAQYCQHACNVCASEFAR